MNEQTEPVFSSNLNLYQASCCQKNGQLDIFTQKNPGSCLQFILISPSLKHNVNVLASSKFPFTYQQQQANKMVADYGFLLHTGSFKQHIYALQNAFKTLIESGVQLLEVEDAQEMLYHLDYQLIFASDHQKPSGDARADHSAMKMSRQRYLFFGSGVQELAQKTLQYWLHLEKVASLVENEELLAQIRRQNADQLFDMISQLRDSAQMEKTKLAKLMQKMNFLYTRWMGGFESKNLPVLLQVLKLLPKAFAEKEILDQKFLLEEIQQIVCEFSPPDSLMFSAPKEYLNQIEKVVRFVEECGDLVSFKKLEQLLDRLKTLQKYTIKFSFLKRVQEQIQAEKLFPEQIQSLVEQMLSFYAELIQNNQPMSKSLIYVQNPDLHLGLRRSGFLTFETV